MSELTDKQNGPDCQQASGPYSELDLVLFRVLKSLVFRSHPSRSALDELPITQLRCLHIIHQQQGMRMAEVCTRLETKLPAISQIVDRLVKRGMVERRSDPSDRRVVRLFLTSVAQAVLAESDAVRQARTSATVARLSERSMRSVMKGLELLAEAAEQVEDAERQTAPRLAPEPDPLMELMTRQTRRQPVKPNRVSPEPVKHGQTMEGLRAKPHKTATV